MSIRLYVGNLPKETVDREALHAVFSGFGEDVSTKVIKDRKTGKCRGFAFVTVPTDEVADKIIAEHNGNDFMDVSLKIEKALPREKSEGAEKEGGRSNNGGNKGRGAKKRSNNQGSNNYSSAASNQPDPRWADDLAKLKEMLAAQGA